MDKGAIAIESCLSLGIHQKDNVSDKKAAEMPQCMFALFCCDKRHGRIVGRFVETDVTDLLKPPPPGPTMARWFPTGVNGSNHCSHRFQFIQEILHGARDL